ncbi:LacI family DNA-binding transcriptional regulator [Bacillus sp. 179-C3.3 HS]|uniref:LacI family DNA-binding transcriptional regulator n=1 Tax=Bacillus sp. 179-C3.3 HS TaxID=3232162 RepID=UPI0039A3DFD5
MKEKKQTKVTINEVAAYAGVSKSTVSRYINGKTNEISPEKVKKIKKAIDELHYRPSQLAQGLKVRKSKVIGFIVADITNPFSVATLRGVEEICDQYGYSIMVCNTDNRPEKEREMLLKLNAHYIEGLIINTTGQNNDILQDFKKSGIPIVLVDRKLPELKVDTVTTNNRDITIRLLQQMDEKGYEQIAFFSEPVEGISPREERKDAYVQTVLSKNKKPIVVEIDLKQKEQMREEVRHFLQTVNQKKAILAGNGLLMLKLISELVELGISIPEEIGIAGFDDTEWYKLIGPGITTVAQPSHDMGKAAMQKIKMRLEGDESAPQTIQLDGEIIVRKSL